MALVLKDRVKETSTTAGTGTITLAGAVAGFQSFSAVGNGNSTYYAIVDPATGAWEVGIGTYTSSGTTLSRTTVLSSSNSGSLVSFAANSKDVFVTYPSERAVWLDSAGNVLVQYEFNTINATTANITTANLTSGTISTTPTSNTDIVNKQYADAIASGIHFHEAVDLATTAALPANTYNNGTSGVGATLTANANGALSVDSTLTVVSNRILVKNQVTQANNGVYTVTQVGSAGTPYILTRATDFDTAGTGVDQIDEGDFFLVTSGTVNANTAWVQQTAPPITIGTTAIVFQQFSAPITYTAGTGLSESPTYTFNIANTGTAGTYGSASAVPVFVTNAQGQVTSVTNTNIAINGSAVTGNISGSAGSVANALTLGTYLTGTSFNGSAAVTATVDATSANTASKVVARDASGNFSAGTITATLSGAATSATTATNIAGGAANQIPYQTAAGTTSFITAASGTNYVLNYTGSAFSWVAGTISGIPLGSTLNSLTAGTYLTGTAYNGSAAQTWTVDATSANTASKVVARDASGNFSAGTITASLSGNASTATSATNVTGTVATTNGGTGLTSFTSGGVVYASSTSALATSSNLTYNGTSTLTIANGNAGLASTGNLYLDAAAGASVNLRVSGYTAGVQVLSTSAITFNTASSERVRIDTAGNVGLGNTPSAWGSGIKSLQVGNYTALTNNQGGYTWLSNNAFYDTAWKYLTTNRALYYAQDTGDGGHKWFNAASGTAGAAITFTQAMTLDASGNLGVGKTSPSVRLDVEGSGSGVATIKSTSGPYALGLIGSTTSSTVYLGANGNDFVTYVNGSERFRIASAGQLGIGGANYGTAGQVLTSAGSGAAPSWQTSAAAAKGFAVGMSLVFGR